MKTIIKNKNGKDISIDAEKTGSAVLLTSGDHKFTWTPHPRTGRTKEDVQREFDAAVEAFSEEIFAKEETNSFIDELLNEV